MKERNTEGAEDQSPIILIFCGQYGTHFHQEIADSIENAA
jgi:hypothetical protein